jgi:hypothetical protein
VEHEFADMPLQIESRLRLRQSINQRRLEMKKTVLLLVAALVASVGCQPAPTPTPVPTSTSTPTSTPIPPTPTTTAPASRTPAGGDWVSSTDWGKLVLTVDSTGTSITKVSYQFSNFKCGPVSNSGTITSSGGNNPIINGKFTLKVTMSGSQQDMTVNGEFDATGQKVSGTWVEMAYGNKCSGVWEATAPK